MAPVPEPDGREPAGASARAAGPNRIELEIEMAGERHEVWFESSARLSASGDVALAAALVPAMAAASELTIDGELDPRLEEHLADIQGIVRSWRNDWDFPRGRPETVPVRARAANGADRGPATALARPEAAFFSGGVDSFDLVLATPSATQLVFVSGFDFGADDPHEGRFLGYAAETAADLGRELIVVRTNLREFSERFAPWISYYGSAMAAIGMALAPSVGRLRIASSVSYAYPTPGGCESAARPSLEHRRGRVRALPLLSAALREGGGDRQRSGRAPPAARLLGANRRRAQLRTLREVPADDGRARRVRRAR